jgi:hypothetical protein
MNQGYYPAAPLLLHFSKESQTFICHGRLPGPLLHQQYQQQSDQYCPENKTGQIAQDQKNRGSLHDSSPFHYSSTPQANST